MPETEGTESPGNERWGVVGGGVLGMTLARRLALAGRRVTLFEAGATWGGLASAWTIGPVEWDRHYHVTLESDHVLRALLAELGLESEIEWRQIETGLVWNGVVHPMTRPLELARFRGLSLLDKARLALTVLRAARIDDPAALEDETAVAWLHRWSGRRTVARIWRPLLRSKLGDGAERVAATFIWASIRRLQGAKDGTVRQDRFGFVPGGYGRIFRRFEEELAGLGVELRLRCAAARVDRDPDGGVRIALADGSVERFDRVVLTVPSPLVSRIATALADEERAAHARVAYQGIVCASLLLRRPLSRFYVLNLADPGFPFTGVVEMTALVDRARLGGHALVYLPCYLAPDDPRFELDDETLRRDLFAGLRRIEPGLVDDDVVAFRVSRARHVFAVPQLGHSRRVPPARTSVDGLFVVNSTRILDGTLNVNETLRVAESAAAWLLAGAPGAAPAPPAAAVVAIGGRSNWSDALERREAELFLERALPHLDPCSTDRVLDLGCGAGHVAEALAALTAEVHALDVDPEALARARLRAGGRRNLRFHQLDPVRYTRLAAVEGRRFSLVLCVSVLQYYRDLGEIESLAQELHRCTEPGARLLVADLPVPRGEVAEAFEFVRWRAGEAGLATAARELRRGAALRRLRQRAGRAPLRPDPLELEQLFERSGFAVERLPGLTVHGGRLNLLMRRAATGGSRA